MLRSACRSDIDSLVALQAATFGRGDLTVEGLTENYRRFFPEVFLRRPAQSADEAETDASDSLVFANKQGDVTGFVGIVKREMEFDGEPIRMAVSNRYCVFPDARGTLAGVQLLRSFLNGDQDLAVADLANDQAKQIWCRLGGRVSPLMSLDWIRMLRPLSHVAHRVGQRPRSGWAGRMAAPFANVADRATGSLPRSPWKIPQTHTTRIELTRELYHEHFEKLTRPFRLRPRYDRSTTDWLWSRIPHMWEADEFKLEAVVDAKDRILGWFIYEVQPNDVSRVAQLLARPEHQAEVLYQLFLSAKEAGAAAVSGHLQPELSRTLTSAGCHIRCEERNFLIHSRRPELMTAIDRGEAMISPLEGESILGFWDNSAEAAE